VRAILGEIQNAIYTEEDKAKNEGEPVWRFALLILFFGFRMWPVDGFFSVLTGPASGGSPQQPPHVVHIPLAVGGHCLVGDRPAHILQQGAGRVGIPHLAAGHTDILPGVLEAALLQLGIQRAVYRLNLSDPAAVRVNGPDGGLSALPGQDTQPVQTQGPG